MPTLPAYTNAAEVFTAVAARLSRDPDELLAVAGVRWTPLCDAGANNANAYIHRALLAKGYTPAQLAADPTIPPLARRLAVFYALLDGAQTNEYGIEAIEKLGELAMEELKGFPVVDEQAQQDPTGQGAIASGTLSALDDVTYPWAG